MTIFLGRRSTRLTILQQLSKKLWKKKGRFLITFIYIYIYILCTIYTHSSSYRQTYMHTYRIASMDTYIHVNRHTVELHAGDFYHIF